jgi:NAD(P)-dependent dehydrogenase (short-subunit alcohol dehydrogenase family)
MTKMQDWIGPAGAMSRSCTEPADAGAAKPGRRGMMSSAALGIAAAAVASAVQAQTLRAPAPMSGRANPQGRFAGKVVLVTGATYGIGQTTAEAFARQGAKVVFCGRTEELGRRVEAGIRDSGGDAAFIRADVRQDAEVRALVDETVRRHGRLDVAFNNAGYFMDPARSPRLVPGPLHEMSDEHWATIMDTNAGGVLRCMRAEVPVMLRAGGGVIINNASVSGHVAFAGMSGYAASKHAVIGLTKVAAAELAERNIRVVSISPLAVDTPMLQASFRHFGLDPQAAAAGLPLRRINTTDEIARAVLFLASDEASSLGGSDLDVTGGYLTR